MGIMTTLTSIFSKQAADATAAYHDLVRLAAEDKPHNKDRAVEIIEAAGKTFDQFTADVSRMTERMAAAAALKECEEVSEDFQKANARLEELEQDEKRELIALRNKFQGIRKTENLRERGNLTRYSQSETRRLAAIETLNKSADPAIDTEIEEIKERVRQLQRRTRVLVDRKDALAANVNTLREAASRTPSGTDAKNFLSQANEKEQELATVKKELNLALTWEKEALQAALSQAMNRKLIP